jgi:outer membrane lipoprotein-sorting protein
MEATVKLIIGIIILLNYGLLQASLSSTEQGRVIAAKMDEKNSGFMGEKSQMKMYLRDSSGAEMMRSLKGQMMEVPQDGDRSLMEFLNPADVKGTKMLTWTHKQNSDDQWLYLPSLRRVKRISSRGKAAAFMGSEFSYEDLGGQEHEKYNFKYLRDEKLSEGNCWVLERTSKVKSGYSKQIMWIHQQYYNPLKVEYYDRRGEVLKTATFSDYKQFKVEGKLLWRVGKIHMKNIQTRKESIMVWDAREMGLSFKAMSFSKNGLRK